jgi:hypothetical protein
MANFRDRLAVNKLTMHSFHKERFNLTKLNEAEGKEQYQVEISNRFAALENLDTEMDIDRAWENTGENIKISAKESLRYYELKKHKPWYNKRGSKSTRSKERSHCSGYWIIKQYKT